MAIGTGPGLEVGPQELGDVFKAVSAIKRKDRSLYLQLGWSILDSDRGFRISNTVENVDISIQVFLDLLAFSRSQEQVAAPNI